MIYEMGDIVRFKNHEIHKGLFEIVGLFVTGAHDYSISNDQCDTELHANEDELILVCTRKSRKDI